MGRRTLPFALAALIGAFLLCLLNMGIGLLHTVPEDQHHFAKTLEAFADKSMASSSRRQRQDEGQQPLHPPPPPPPSPPVAPPAADASFNREPVPRPPLDSIVQGWNITGDPSWLLNFAILGFPKCGTSTMMHHLSNHSEIQIFGDERCEMGANQHVPLIRDLYNELPAGPDYVRGIKCPMDLENTKLSMRNYQRVFPKTNYIVGVRHPVLWFESFYNFRIHNKFPMPPPDELIGKCVRKAFSVCTFRGNFHLFLSNLGKTNITDPNEIKYIGQKIRRSMDALHTTQKVFLYEVSQLSDSDPGREAQLRTDLQTFLGLRKPIAPMIWFKPGKKHNEKVLERVNQKKINICDDKFTHLRHVLMEQSINASRWIRQYFIQAPDVFVSSKEHFSSVLMKSWERDPCLDRTPSVINADTTKTTAS
jgi:hypothetical protein